MIKGNCPFDHSWRDFSEKAYHAKQLGGVHHAGSTKGQQLSAGMAPCWEDLSKASMEAWFNREFIWYSSGHQAHPRGWGEAEARLGHQPTGEPGLGGDGAQPYWSVVGAGADGTGGLKWGPEAWAGWRRPRGAWLGQAGLVGPSGPWQLHEHHVEIMRLITLILVFAIRQQRAHQHHSDTHVRVSEFLTVIITILSLFSVFYWMNTCKSLANI